MVEPRGGGGSGAVVLAVALVAGFLFIGGAAAIYLSNPPGPADPTDIAVASGTSTLPPFVQPTATPSPSPTFILLPSESPSFSPLPSGTAVGPTAQPTPVGPTNPPTGSVVARFTCSQQGTSKVIKCQENSTGNVTGWQWTFGDGQTSSERNPKNTYESYAKYTVTLSVTSPTGATDSRTKEITLKPPPTSTPEPTPGPTPADTPTPAPTPETSDPIVVPEATAPPTAPGTPAP